MGTLRAAKKRGVVTFEGELLLQGVHDDVDVVLLPKEAAAVPEEKKEKEAEPAAVAASAAAVVAP